MKKSSLIDRLYLRLGYKERDLRYCRLNAREILLCFSPILLAYLFFSIIHQDHLILALGFFVSAIGCFVYTIISIREGVFPGRCFGLTRKNKSPIEFRLGIILYSIIGILFFSIGTKILYERIFLP